MYAVDCMGTHQGNVFVGSNIIECAIKHIVICSTIRRCCRETATSFLHIHYHSSVYGFGSSQCHLAKHKYVSIGCCVIEPLYIYIFIYGSTALYVPGPPRFVEVSWSHNLDTPQSVGLLWTSDQPVAETST
jgi:hypothetical protein